MSDVRYIQRRKAKQIYDEARRAKRISKRVCWCGKPVVLGKRSCQFHLDLDNQHKIRKYAERRTLGLCVRCGEPALPGMVLCETHWLKERKKSYKELEKANWTGGLSGNDPPVIDERFRDGSPVYFKEVKYMEPDVFLHIQYQFSRSYDYAKWLSYASKAQLNKLEELLYSKKGLAMPILFYDTEGKRVKWDEGRHRGLLAKKLGILLPVVHAWKLKRPWEVKN